MSKYSKSKKGEPRLLVFNASLIQLPGAIRPRMTYEPRCKSGDRSGEEYRLFSRSRLSKSRETSGRACAAAVAANISSSCCTAGDRARTKGRVTKTTYIFSTQFQTLKGKRDPPAGPASIIPSANTTLASSPRHSRRVARGRLVLLNYSAASPCVLLARISPLSVDSRALYQMWQSGREALN